MGTQSRHPSSPATEGAPHPMSVCAVGSHRVPLLVGRPRPDAGRSRRGFASLACPDWHFAQLWANSLLHQHPQVLPLCRRRPEWPMVLVERVLGPCSRKVLRARKLGWRAFQRSWWICCKASSRATQAANRANTRHQSPLAHLEEKKKSVGRPRRRVAIHTRAILDETRRRLARCALPPSCAALTLR